jgi:hypothetical protein
MYRGKRNTDEFVPSDWKDMVLAFHSLNMYLISCSFWKLSRFEGFFFELPLHCNNL